VSNEELSVRINNGDFAIWLTTEYLKGYRCQCQYVAYLAEDITIEEHDYSRSVLASSKEYKELQRKYIKGKFLLKKLQEALGQLPEAERTILQKRYIDRETTPWSEVAETIGYHEKTCYRLRDKALSSVAEILF